MNTLLKKAKELYTKNSLFYSASGLLNTPIRVSQLKLSEVYKDTIVNTEMGIIFSDGVWARKV